MHAVCIHVQFCRKIFSVEKCFTRSLSVFLGTKKHDFKIPYLLPNKVCSRKFSEQSVSSSFQLEDEKLESFYKFDQSLKAELHGFDSASFPAYSNQFADYANSSKILQALLLLGVNLSTVHSKWPECLRFLVTLNFEDDIKPKLQYLRDVGITIQEFGDVLTKYIMILDPTVSVNVLKESTDYLLSKKFSKKDIASIVSRYPQFLNVPYVRLDGILGFYQSLPTNYENRPIYFNGNSLRSIIVRCPQLMTSSLEEVFLIVKTLELSCEFTIAQIRQLVYHRPRILLEDAKKIEILFKYYANEMELSNEQMTKNAFVFDTRLKIIKTRHNYLKYLGRNKYKEDEPGYISMQSFVCTTNEDFCNECRLGPVSKFEQFMKTL